MHPSAVPRGDGRRARDSNSACPLQLRCATRTRPASRTSRRTRTRTGPNHRAGRPALLAWLGLIRSPSLAACLLASPWPPTRLPGLGRSISWLPRGAFQGRSKQANRHTHHRRHSQINWSGGQAAAWSLICFILSFPPPILLLASRSTVG